MSLFTLEQQRQHRMQLADFLETNIAEDDYNSQTWDRMENIDGLCALGHACEQHIGGLTLVDESPFLNETYSYYQSAADEVFGTGITNDLFMDFDLSRTAMIDHLRNF